MAQSPPPMKDPKCAVERARPPQGIRIYRWLYGFNLYEWGYRFGFHRLTYHSNQPLAELMAWHEGGLFRGKRALEVGCGEATNALWLASQGYQVTAVDMSPTALRLAQRRAALQGVELRTSALDLMDPHPELGQFDLIFDRECIEDIRPRERRERYARNVIDWLAPGGAYVVETYIARSGERSPHRPFLMEDELNSLFPSLTLEERPLRRQRDIWLFPGKFWHAVYRFRAPAAPASTGA